MWCSTVSQTQSQSSQSRRIAHPHEYDIVLSHDITLNQTESEWEWERVSKRERVQSSSGFITEKYLKFKIHTYFNFQPPHKIGHEMANQRATERDMR